LVLVVVTVYAGRRLREISAFAKLLEHAQQNDQPENVQERFAALEGALRIDPENAEASNLWMSTIVLFAPGLATKDSPWTNSLGMKFVPVPGAKVSFSIWETRVKDYAVYAAANREANGDWKDREYTQRETQPVTKVSWRDAQAFCEWLTRKEQESGALKRGQRYRLPTDAEWSWAVGIGALEPPGEPLDKNGRIKKHYPWGRTWPAPPSVGRYQGTPTGFLTFGACSCRQFPPKPIRAL
jgi:hypothetical protein